MDWRRNFTGKEEALSYCKPSFEAESRVCGLRPSQIKEEKLKSEGWTYMFTASGNRLREMVEVYESLGFEVHLEPIKPEDVDEACRACLEAEARAICAIYTRAKEEAEP